MLCCLWTFGIWLPQIEGQYLKQPGDVALTAIPGYPLSEEIPCVLDRQYSTVEWEQDSSTDGLNSISHNKAIYPQYDNVYEFVNHDPWDYSIRIKLVPANQSQVRCFFVDTNWVNHSTWSNITLTGKHGVDTWTLISLDVFTH